MAQPPHAPRLALSVILTLAAVTIAVAAVKLVFFPGPPTVQPAVRAVDGALQREPNWDEIVRTSVPAVGTLDARALLIEVVDLECPFCRRFHLEALHSARERFGNQLAVAYVHWPLPNHRLARPGRSRRFVSPSSGPWAKMERLEWSILRPIALN